MEKILIVTGGPRSKLDSFSKPIENLKMDVTLASFYDLEYSSLGGKNFSLKIQGIDIKEFQKIYIRLVGKRLEDATLIVNYAHQKGVKLVDRVYEHSIMVASTLSKAMELKKLIEAGIPLPPTYFGSLRLIREKAPGYLGFPYVIKSTSGRRGRDAWLVENNQNFDTLFDELRTREKEGVRFFAQSLVRASQRVRVLTVGDKVLGAITRPTKWRKHFVTKINGEIPEGVKESLVPVPQNYSDLALRAAKAVELDIAGVDILVEDETQKLWVIEANAGPSWNLIKKDCGVEVEEKILEFLAVL